MLNPALHKPVPMGERVRLPEHYYGGLTGTVVGISSVTIVFFYIVLLDEPIETEYGTTRALSVPGPDLLGLDGVSHWRL